MKFADLYFHNCVLSSSNREFCKLSERGGAKALIAARLIPIFPFSIVCYAAGAARVPVWRYTWTTAVGYLPITALSVYFGTQLDLLSGLF